jgi:hypothetical protein
VVDAPGLVDDYYLNLLDWSSGNQVAIGLDRDHILADQMAAYLGAFERHQPGKEAVEPSALLGAERRKSANACNAAGSFFSES